MGERPYRCRACAWRGWRLEIGPALTREKTTRAADPPNLKGTKLARIDPRLQVDLKKIDEFDRVSDEDKTT